MSKPDDSNHGKDGTANTPDMSRRGWFRKLGAVGASTTIAAAAAATGCKKGWTPPENDKTGKALAKPYVPGAEEYGKHEERWLNTSCAQCSAGCGVRVRVVEGRAVRVEGNSANPVNRGGIGARGLSSLQAMYDPDRIKGPMERRNGRLVSVSWDHAMAKLTDWLAEVRKRGPQNLLVMTGTERGFTHELFARFSQAYGTPNFIDGRPGHGSAIAQAMEASLGVHESPAFDWAGARTVLSLEAALVEDSCQSVYFARVAGELHHGERGVRAKLIHAGPMFDLAAYNADQWMRIKPGTSGALALGVCHVLLDEYDAGDLLDDQAYIGVDALRAFVKRFTLDRVAAITGIRARDVAALAKNLWMHRPSFVLVDERSVAYSNGWHTALAALSLNALLGSVEAPDGGLRLAPQPAYQPWPSLALDDIAKKGLDLPRLDGAGTKAFPRARSIHQTLPEAMAKASPQMALLHYTDPVFARAQPESWRKALDGVGFVVSFSPYMDDTVSTIANLVLPDHMFLERWEDAGSAPGIPRAVAGIRRPVVKPLFDTRSSADVLIAAAKKLGGSTSRAMPWKTFREAIKDRWRGLHKLKRGTIVATNEREFLRKLNEQGVWAEETNAAVQPVTFQFHTGYELPKWEGSWERYPFKLIAYRSLGYGVGGGANQPWLRMLRARPGQRPWDHEVAMNPADANSYKDGDTVTISSQWGSIRVRVRHDHRLMRGCLAIPMGRGQRDMGRWARNNGANVMALLHPGAAPITGANILCGTRVRIDAGKAPA